MTAMGTAFVALLLFAIPGSGRAQGQVEEGVAGSADDRTDDDVQALRNTLGTVYGSPVVISYAQLIAEMGDQGLVVEQQIRLVNLGKTAHRLEGQSSIIELSQGYQAFESMITKPSGDQMITELPGTGLQITGILPPGNLVAAWRFQLPLTGSEARFSVQFPWDIVIARVMTGALPGVELHVQGMPKARVQTERGLRLLVTEVERKPTDPSRRTLSVSIAGFAETNPMRWFALVLSMVVLVIGVIVAFRTPLDRQRAFQRQSR